MKNKYLILGIAILSIIVAMSFTRSNNSKFYYAYNEKITLIEIENRIIVRYKQNKKSDRTKISLNQELVNKPIEWKDDSTCVIFLGDIEKELIISKILNQTDVKTCNPVYAINTGLEMGVTDEFLVKFNENVAQTEIDMLHEKFGVEVVKTTDIYQLLKVQNGMDALQIANMYQESGLTRFSHPNFYSKVELNQVIPNDPYFANQFALNNTGQVFTDGHSGTVDADIDAPEAWTMSTGNNNITIAVLDEGVTSDHPDLPNTRQVRLNGSNFADGDANNPSPTGNHNHGNACAGIIGATQNNNQGISGIAPNCRIMPIRIFNSDGSGISTNRLAEAIDFARTNGAHVISNSWSYDSDNPNLFPVIKDAITRATTQGRNNRGCVVVFAAGNNPTNNGYVHFPSNVDVAGVLTVGASDRFDLKAFYSPLGNPSSSNNQLIDVVAPSHRAYSFQIIGETFEAWSIDIPGDAGYNSVHETDGGTLPVIGSILPNAGVNNLAYTGRFGGTSHACPVVAGVAALMLSINPNLTQQQVFDILTTNADQVGGYTYTNGRSNELGFGRVNACRAVTKAILTIASISGPSLVCTSGASFTVNNPNGATITWTNGGNLTMVSAQGANPCTFAANSGKIGTDFIRASLSTSCGNIDLPLLYVNLSGPHTSDVHMHVWSNYEDPTTTLCKNTVYHFNIYETSGQYTCDCTNYSWSFPAGWTVYYASSSGIALVNTRNSPSGLVEVRANTSCCSENAKIYSKTWSAQIGCDNGEYLMFSPNPSSSETTITIESDSEEGFDETAEWDLEVYDQSQVIQVKESKLNGKAYTLNTSGWKEGVYVVRVNYKGKAFTGKLVVKK